MARVDLTRFRGHLILSEQKVFMMSKIHSKYPPDFRQQMVDLVRSGRTPESLAWEFEPSAQADRDLGRRKTG